MNTETLRTINKLDQALSKLAEPWRANHFMEVTTQLITLDTGTIKPEFLVEFKIIQPGKQSCYIEMPVIPRIYLIVESAHDFGLLVDYHIKAISSILGNPPSAADWEKAKERYHSGEPEPSF